MSAQRAALPCKRRHGWYKTSSHGRRGGPALRVAVGPKPWRRKGVLQDLPTKTL
ncbi:hypothetical protein B0H67DRAFT_566217 [Lasiosphaeris hirsuta]|uniref:Uncharacterized protein n=1 Tax=Lasiosphaeris hirsuta TaxID=260670 RepID=A0AA40BCV0_9PEZI|nr:hypothetical protein B0H67DRAFT_566217 [Lasiosphaeris hirsuta]